MIYRWWRRVAGVALVVAVVLQSPAAALEPVDIELIPDEPVVVVDELAQEAVPEEGALDTLVSEAGVVEQLPVVAEPEPPQLPIVTPITHKAPVAAEPITAPVVDPPEVSTVDDGVKHVRITEVLINGDCRYFVATCSGTTAEFIELYNPGAAEISLDGVAVRYSRSGSAAASSTTVADLTGYRIAPGGWLVIGKDIGAVAHVAMKGDFVAVGGGVALVRSSAEAAETIDKVAWGDVVAHADSEDYFYTHPAVKPSGNTALQRCASSGFIVDATVRDTSQEFMLYKAELPTPSALLSCSVDQPEVPVESPDTKVNTCEGLALSEIGANIDQQFVELHNISDAPLDMAGCRIMTNRSSSIFFALPSIVLASQDFFTLKIETTPLTLTKTTTGTVYLLSSDGTEVDSQSYANVAKDTSWALTGDGWRQTYKVTAGAANEYQQYVPCSAGYERNEETGRCRTIAVAAEPVACGEGKYRSEETNRCRSITGEPVRGACATHQVRNPDTNRCRNIALAAIGLTPCRADQYRSPETNRCRATVVAATTRTPCKAGQERNPATNRCRTIATTASTLKPCAAGQERNPETNRCRKAAQGDAGAGFKVVEGKAGADHLVSWLALGGLGSVALGYAAWEWRREVQGVLGKAFGSLPFVK